MTSKMSGWSRTSVEELWGKWGGESENVNWGGLEELIQLWKSFGEGVNLVGSTDEGFLWKQVAEGLMAAWVIRNEGLEGGSWLDLGSGGGLPGLVISMAVSGQGILVEPRVKRVDFLKLAQRKLRLEHVKVRRGRVVGGRFDSLDGGPSIDEGFDVVGSRAVFDRKVWLEVAGFWTTQGGLALVHTGEEFVSPEEWTCCRFLKWERWCVTGLRRKQCST